MKIKEMVLRLLYPPRCPVCDDLLEPGEMARGIHADCEAKLYPVTGTVCMHCGRPLVSETGEYCYDCLRLHKQTTTAIAQGKALYLYQGAVKTAMYRLKYSNRREYARVFAERAMEAYGEWIRSKGIEAIVPVPMYPKKRKARGYNQAEAFARELSKLTGIPTDAGLVKRICDTTPQKELDDVARKNNLKNAFQLGRNDVQYRQVLVVDDIYTTGSTAEAVAEELRRIPDIQIFFLSVCIGKGM